MTCLDRLYWARMLLVWALIRFSFVLRLIWLATHLKKKIRESLGIKQVGMTLAAIKWMERKAALLVSSSISFSQQCYTQPLPYTSQQRSCFFNNHGCWVCCVVDCRSSVAVQVGKSAEGNVPKLCLRNFYLWLLRMQPDSYSACCLYRISFVR